MVDVCFSCGKCCMATEMMLSEQDIGVILDHKEQYISKDEFTVINKEGIYQLRNVDGYCFFFNHNTKKCKIYDFRPQGCRFYPLVYDPIRKKCIYDQVCPHPKLIYQNSIHLKSICNSLKKFLKTQLNIKF
jgi:Fe-S-cluster containining protein